MIGVLKQDSNKQWIKQNMSIQDFHEKFLRDRDKGRGGGGGEEKT